MKFAMTNAGLLIRLSDEVHTLRSEDVVANPGLELRRICQFLNVTCSREYIQDCSNLVRKNTSKSRNAIIWNQYLKNIVYGYIRRIPFYSKYTFDR